MRYASPAAFRQALDDRLRQRGEGGDLARLRRQVVFERFLTRLFRVAGDQWVLKGGYALELRLRDGARATQDLDFHAGSAEGRAGGALETLQEAADLDLGDHFEFAVQQPAGGRLTGPPEGGQRFTVTASLDGRVYTTFRVDVGWGDQLTGTVDHAAALIDLTFADLPAETFPIYPRAQHFAEKLHAYTRPRSSGENTRVKDLVDLALLLQGPHFPEPAEVLRTTEGVFDLYGSHPLPAQLPAPPRSWESEYRRMEGELNRELPEMEAVVQEVQTFLDAGRAAQGDHTTAMEEGGPAADP